MYRERERNEEWEKKGGYTRERYRNRRICSEKLGDSKASCASSRGILMADWPAVEVSIGELIANACTDACQESLRRLFHRYTHDRGVCVCVCVYTSRCVVIVGGLIKACYAASRPSNQTRRRFNIYENYPIVSNIVRDRWIDATRWVLKIVVRLFYAGFRRRFMRLAHACTPCYGLLRDEE